MLEEAADLFKEAQMYEAMSEVYKLVLPIHEAHRNHEELEKVYIKLSHCYNQLVQKGQHRFLGSYFRVGFYGLIFGDMDRQEYIYKEPGITRLGEFTLKLQVRLKVRREKEDKLQLNYVQNLKKRKTYLNTINNYKLMYLYYVTG